MSSLNLPQKPTLADFQKFTADMVEERNFEKRIPEAFILMMEEMGELATAIRYHHDMHTDPNTEQPDVSSELADIFTYTLDLSNKFGVDLEEAFRKKQTYNQDRTWDK